MIKRFISSKSKGDDKLVISLVLIAVGVGLCIVFRNSIFTLLGSAITNLTAQVNALFDGTVVN